MLKLERIVDLCFYILYRHWKPFKGGRLQRIEPHELSLCICLSQIVIRSAVYSLCESTLYGCVLSKSRPMKIYWSYLRLSASLLKMKKHIFVLYVIYFMITRKSLIFNIWLSGSRLVPIVWVKIGDRTKSRQNGVLCSLLLAHS